MIYDIVIIGGASAGLTAGIYAGRKKMSTVMLTKKVGGQALLTNSVENYPGFDFITGNDLTDKIRAQAEKYGLEIKEGTEVVKINKKNDTFFTNTRDGQVFESKTIIIATGKNPKRLNIPGEKEFENKGVSFCATCDGPLFGGKDVAVIGGGNSGLENALDLTKYADKIYVITHASKIKGDELFQDNLKRSGKKVEFITDAETLEIKGSDFVESIIYKDKKSNEEKELKVGGVFVSIGWTPATSFLGDFVGLNKYGEVIVDHKTTAASVGGVFAAGDVSDVLYKQFAIATAEGAKAALSAYSYIVASSSTDSNS